MSASTEPRLAGRQPSNRGGVPRVKTWRTVPCGAARKRGRPPRVPHRRRRCLCRRRQPTQGVPAAADPADES